MIDEAVPILGVDREQLLDEMRDVHKHYGNSEQPFALLDAPSVHARFPDLSRAARASELDPAFHAFNRMRKSTLAPYPGVAETLDKIHEVGCAIVAHTEAPTSNAIFRIQMLGLSDYFSALYAPVDKGLGHPARERGALPVPVRVHSLEAGTRKPAPGILLRILEEAGVQPAEALYVGDSITRDIAMAKLAGTRSAFAKYGRAFDAGLWQQLVRVTHWTEEDVRAEAELRKEFAGLRADCDLGAFSELVEHYAFAPTIDTDERTAPTIRAV
jgi:phosphoglycolate phosphatase